MKKKGFTLVELLAVVVILAVVSIITIPIIINLINAAQKGALKDSATGLLKSADLYYSIHKMQDKEFEDTDFSVVDGKFTSEKKLDYKGQVKNAYLRIFSDGEMALCVDDGQYSIVKSVEQNIKDVEPTESICTGEFDDATMSYTTSGSHNYGEILLNVKAYSDVEALSKIKGRNADIGIITSDRVTGYYVSYTEPEEKKEGMVWLISRINTGTDITSTKGQIPVSYAVQFVGGEWIIKDSYLYDGKEEKWQRLEFYETSEYVYNYSYTGKYETFTAPLAGTYQIELWGAQGGTNHSSYPGGLGAYTKGDIYLDEGEELYIYVGGAGSYVAGGSTTNGGWNGGGYASGSGSGGGGATDVRLTKTAALTTWNDFNSLKSRIMVAAGGGGGAFNDYTSNGNYYASNGGGGGALSGGFPNLVGPTQYYEYLGSGASQTTGAGFGTGGAGTGYKDSSYYNGLGRAGGGGGGYYGGTGGNHGNAWNTGAGGGGSSFISGYQGCNAINLTTTTSQSQIFHTDQPNHQSGKVFENGEMRPIANGGNGRATITFKWFGSNELSKKDTKPGDSFLYNYSGSYEAFHVKTSGLYKVECWGAQGATNHGSYPGGKGGYTKGEIELKEGDTLYIYVGGAGSYTKGGWNGGGNVTISGNGGGGATDIRVNVTGGGWNDFNSLKNRIMVAAGGGGGAYNPYTSNGTYGSVGGAGGGMTGLGGYSLTASSKMNFIGKGATQTSGGSGSGVGGFGYGGTGAGYRDNSYYNGLGRGGGGGGGWYGGGGGTHSNAWHASAGGGGSSYISGHPGCNAVRSNSTADNILHLDISESPTGYVFKNTEMKTDVKTGNGQVIITMLKSSEATEQESNVYVFEYAGSYVPFIIPKTGYYQVEFWGAQGTTNHGSYAGGLGAYTSGKIKFNKGTIIYVYVGGVGIKDRGGFNGGGNTLGTGYNGGGGATDIRIEAGLRNETSSLSTRIMVAAGGGGGAYNNYTSNGSYCSRGGAGGGLSGYNGVVVCSSQSASYEGRGASQSAAGSGGGGAGRFGYGGDGSSYTDSSYYNGLGFGGGGGGGWFGGSGGTHGNAWHASGGGGGSSYISGHAGCIGVTREGTLNASSYSTISDSYSYTGYKFTDTVMVDGEGYEWTTSKGSYTGMPNHDGTTTMKGNQGSGYAKFTYLGT